MKWITSRVYDWSHHIDNKFVMVNMEVRSNDFVTANVNVKPIRFVGFDHYSFVSVSEDDKEIGTTKTTHNQEDYYRIVIDKAGKELVDYAKQYLVDIVETRFGKVE